MDGPRLTLGSASARRRDLLAQIGVVPDAICPADIDETPRPGELPRLYVERMAREKAQAIDVEGFLLTADTVVSLGRRILGKPEDAGEAAEFLLKLSGRRHRVTTSVCLRAGATLRQKTVETRVKVKRLSDAEISAYLRSGEWRGKAGGYAIQGIGAAFIPEIIGSYTNVVGLPLTETAGLLGGMGYPVSLDGAPA
ncbi:MAG: nucleoside triphosphate pyrophosphatase [Pseudomonadota bacterium]